MTQRHAPWETHADFAVGLRPIAPAAWLEGGEADPAARKDPLIAAHPSATWAADPDSDAGQSEVLELVSAALGAEIDPRGRPPLLAAARAVPDDLCLMERRGSDWRLTAACLCAPSFFAAHQVIGRGLGELHGPVEGFAERFLVRVRRVFEGLRPGMVLERRNWTVVNSAEPFMPSPAAMRAAIAAIEPDEAGRILHLRVERQTLRRLPRTGGVLFTIRVWLTPLAALSEPPARLSAFARAWRAAPPAFRAYKNLSSYDRLIEEFLRAQGESYSVNAV